MLPEDQVANMTLDQVNKEIENRYELMNQMTGWLYPSILSDEINQLLKRRMEFEPEPVKLQGPPGTENPTKYLGELATGVSLPEPRIIPNFELEIFPKIKKVLKEKYAGWDHGSMLCPGKAHHLSFRLKKDGQIKMLHFLESDHDVWYEDAS